MNLLIRGTTRRRLSALAAAVATLHRTEQASCATAQLAPLEWQEGWMVLRLPRQPWRTRELRARSSCPLVDVYNNIPTIYGAGLMFQKVYSAPDKPSGRGPSLPLGGNQGGGRSRS